MFLLLNIIIALCSLMLICGKSDTSPSGGEIKIIGPRKLKEYYKNNFGKIEAKPALFGIPVYNGHFVGTIYVDKSNLEGCKAWPDRYFQSDPFDENTKRIALVQRGICTFVKKVQNCQDAGAKGVVVYDDVQRSLLPIMADDGMGDSVSIPSIIIKNADGLVLKSNINDNLVLDVEIEISWGLPRPDGKVEWELWCNGEMSSREKKFVAEFREVVELLGEKYFFTPHYWIQNGMLEAADADCSNDRKYCVFSTSGVPGNKLLKEILNQICIWKFGEEANDHLVWWDYIDEFNKCCVNDLTRWCGTCSQDIIERISNSKRSREMLSTSIDNCIFNSGGMDGQKNTLFDEEIQSFLDFGIYWSPAVTINGERYHGNMLCPNPVDISTCSVFAAICAGFAPETTPEVCMEHMNSGCPRGMVRDVCGVCGGDGLSCISLRSKSMLVVFVILVLIIVTFALATAYYLRLRFSEAQREFNAFSSMYLPLTGDEEELRTGGSA